MQPISRNEKSGEYILASLCVVVLARKAAINKRIIEHGG
jgi:hypothetical protein